jgi:hypothetical protein
LRYGSEFPCLQGNLPEKQRKWRKKARFIAENLTLDQSLARQFRCTAEQRNLIGQQRNLFR